MTRQYWSYHERREGLQTHNSHIAALLINNFLQSETLIEHYPPYQRWKQWLKENPRERKKQKGTP